jgi:hypothetical protein
MLYPTMALVATIRGEGPPVGSAEGLIFYTIAFPGLLVFGCLLIHAVRQLFDKRPLLVIDDTGIELPSANMPKFAWSEVLDVAPVKVGSVKFLGIVPRDIEDLVSRYPHKKVWLQQNFKRFRSAAVVREQSSPVKFSALMQEIGPLCHAKIQQHAPGGAFANPPPPRMQM